MPYKTGFVGATTNDASDWVAEQAKGAKKILVPFAGSGKDIASMARTDTIIESWDTQFYSRSIIEGVFSVETAVSNVDTIHYRKGYMYESRALKNIDERCAGFIDWVAEYGTLFDKACMTSAAIRCTLMGRGNQWYANMEQFWKRFNTAREYNAQWVNRPGEFIHHEESFFSNLPKGHYDLMQIDSPKVVVGSDVYSANFQALNKMFGGAVNPLPKWSWRDVIGSFRDLASLDIDRVILLYVSGVRPTYEDVRNTFSNVFDVELEKMFQHKKRTDYGLVLRKKI